MEIEKCPLKVVREKLGLSQKELSLLSGGSIQNLAGVETGTRQSIPAKILLALKTHANVDTEKLQKEHRGWYLKFTEARMAEIIKRLRGRKAP
jgi:transcriptional regulator with XRE-family HTH domain